MTELQENLYVVIVPANSTNFQLGKDYLAGNNMMPKKIDIPFNDCVISFLGTASEKEITFDCDPFVKSRYYGFPIMEKKYYDYCIGIYFFDIPAKSFISLASSKGIELKDNEKLLVIKKL